MQLVNLSNNPENLIILEQLAEQLPDIFFIFDLNDKRIRYLNPAFDDVWGASRSVIANNPTVLLETIHPEDISYVTDHLQNASWRSSQTAEFRIMQADGSEKWLSFRSYPIINPDNSHSIIGFAEDITSQKDHHFVLLKFSERKNAVLHSLSHDLAGPINIINSLSEIVSKENKAYNNTRITETIAAVQHTCQKSISLIKELLNNEFLESSEADINRNRFDITFKIQDILTVYRQLNLNTPKEITFQSSHPVVYLTGDESKLMQVMNNLVSNANKFTPQGGHISVSVTDQGSTILLTVADTGIGIPQPLQPLLFDKFTKARRPGLLGEEPVGLGMSIIKNIVELHHGSISFTSKENEGTTFYVELPKG